MRKDNKNIFTYWADEGNFIVRKSDGQIMGDVICLGESDDIGNYEDRPFTEESRAEFFKSIGMEDMMKRGRGMSRRGDNGGKPPQAKKNKPVGTTKKRRKSAGTKATKEGKKKAATARKPRKTKKTEEGESK